jgi:reactive intermediate/imine deaminase
VAAPIRGYYSNAVRVTAGPLLFVAGQVGVDRTGAVVGKDSAATQAEQALKNIQDILAASDATMDDVVKVTVYVTDMKYLDEITPVRMKYFPANGPASVIVEVSRLALPDLKVEIDAVAAVK